MRLVLDTNTALSGLLWGGTPGRLIDAAETGRIELASSAPLLDELKGVLARISHQSPTADADGLAVARRTRNRRLDVVSATPSPPIPPCAAPQRHLDALVTASGEKCGLAREKFARQLARRGLAVADLFDGYTAVVNIVKPATIEPTIIRDLADDQVLAAALAAQATLIVSGDSHLLDLKKYRGVEIITAARAVERIEASSMHQGIEK